MNFRGRWKDAWLRLTRAARPPRGAVKRQSSPYLQSRRVLGALGISLSASAITADWVGIGTAGSNFGATQTLLLSIGVVLVLFASFVPDALMARVCERWTHFWFRPTRPTNLALCRGFFFGAILFFYQGHDFSAWSRVSEVFWQPIWLFRRFHLPILSGELVLSLQILWKVALGLSCIGLFTRVSTATSFLLGIYLLGLPHNFGKTHHYDAIVVFVLAIMALSRCGDGYSMDQWIRIIRRKSNPLEVPPKLSGEYTWPVRGVWVVMAMIFLGAGVAKIRRSGLEWIVSDNLQIVLIQHNYHSANTEPLTSWGLYVAQYGWLCQLLAGATIVFEAGYPLALFSRTARWILVPGALLMQVGIRVFMGPSFEQFMICNLFWVPWDAAGRRLAVFARSDQKHVIVFDGGCGLCQRTIAATRGLDLLQRVEFCDASNDWARIEGRFAYLEQGACLQDMHVVTPGGQVFRGFDAYRALARVLPLGWVVLPFLYLPGVPPMGRHIYARVASRRRRNGCPLPLSESSTDPPGTCACATSQETNSGPSSHHV